MRKMHGTKDVENLILHKLNSMHFCLKYYGFRVNKAEIQTTVQKRLIPV